MNELHLFAGCGGGILGGMLLGHKPVCAVEINPYCRKVLMQRQRDGFLPWFPVWDDITTFDASPWRGLVDAVCGGFPCQDISLAGKGAGLNGKKSGLWSEMARVVREVGPSFVFVENSAALTSRGLDRVLGDLAEMGYDARWGVFSAADFGARHKRERCWLLAYSGASWKWRNGRNKETRVAWRKSLEVEPEPPRMVDVVADRVDRNDAIGNGQVPIVAATAWRLLEPMTTEPKPQMVEQGLL